MTKEKMKLWVPKELEEDEHVFLMSATHRGDMYHFRAAMQIVKYSVILYDSSADTRTLEDYLKRSALNNKKYIYVVPWKLQAFKDATKPASFVCCSLNGNDVTDRNDVERRNLKVHNESDSTRMIAEKDTLPTAVSKNMAILTDKSKYTLGSQFEELFKREWEITPDSCKILSLYRDTGTRGGVYPELDTGDALGEINEIVTKIPAKDGEKLRTISCGNKDAVSGILSIGQYWAHLEVPTGETARDVEAYFLEWAFKKNYYQMAIGFRSGALDLFTFLGIPTVSIGLRYMIGESRHGLLAKEAFKRVNVQYDQPRHNTTAYVKPRNPDYSPLMSSPFWSDKAPDDVPKRDAGDEDNRKKKQAEKPSNFTAFDKLVLELGLKIAVEKYLKWTKSMQPLKEGISTNPIETHTARYYHPTDLTKKEEKDKYFQDSQKLDENDIEKRKEKGDTLQESDTLFLRYKTSSRDDWYGIRSILGVQNDME